jgi:F0F1-type ATP synthase epsilon subunit
VADNVVSVLTNRAVPATSVDGSAAEAQLSAAIHKPANTPELLEIRDRQIAQARAQIRVSRRARL